MMDLPRLDSATADALLHGRLGDPFAVLGPHLDRGGRLVRSFVPGAQRVDACAQDGRLLGTLLPGDPPGLFAGYVEGNEPYRLHIHWSGGVQETEDPYAFGLLLGDLDLHLFNEGSHFELAFCLGSQAMTIDNIRGVRFAVWAPNARVVSVVGDFNHWDQRRHPMRLRYGAGVWELFVPRIGPGARYKYAIVAADGSVLPF